MNRGRMGLQPGVASQLASDGSAARRACLVPGSTTSRLGPARCRTARRGMPPRNRLGTSLNAMLDRLERAFAEREASQGRLRAFIADASHELRTPLSVIEAQTSLALSQERDVSWYRTAFARVGHESKRMRRLIEDLLWLARFDATSGPPRSEPVDVGVLAAQAVDRFTILAESRRLRLSLQTAPGNNVVTAPPEWLDRLLGVLLDNACKYSREDGIVGVSVASEGQRIRLTVDDSGPGIPEAERQLVFDRFHRATDAASGAGLGLAIADAIVKATNGQWRVGSSSSGGASMSVSWQRSFPEVRETVAASRASSPQRSANS